MERIIVFIIIFVSLLFLPVNAMQEGNLSTLITTQHNKYQNCVRVFNIDNVTLYYLTIAAINANRFQVDEIQSKAGNILFTAVNKQFLATVSNVNTNQALFIINLFKFKTLKLRKKMELLQMAFMMI